jgi:hypothetical protein
MQRQLSAALITAMLVFGAGLASLTVPSLTAAAADPVFPPGLRVGLEPPAGMVLSKTFPGFEDIDRKAAITILDLPVRAYEDIERSAFSPNQPGLTGMKRQSFPFASGIGFLISVQVTENGVPMHKWFLLASVPGQDLATLVNVAVPDSALANYPEAAVLKALASVTLRPTPVAEQISMLPFTVNDMAGFRVVQVLPAGGMIMVDGPTDDLSRQPYMIVAVGRGAPEDPADRGKFSRELLSSAPLRNINVTGAEPMRIGGMQGFEIRAQAVGIAGEPVNLVQWVRFGSGGFLRIVGVGRKEDWDSLFTRFRAVRDGVELK